MRSRPADALVSPCADFRARNNASGCLFQKDRRIRISPLNVTLPFLSLTPVFMILTGYLFLGETLRPPQIVGIIFIASGGYLISIHTVSEELHRPITSIGKEKGALLMIVVAIIYSVAAVLGKKAVLLSNPLFFAFPIVRCSRLS